MFKRVCSERARVHLDTRAVSSSVFYVWTHHKPLKLYGKWTYAVFQCQTLRAISRLCGGIWDYYERGLWSCRTGLTPHKDVFWCSAAHLQMVSPHTGLLWKRYLTRVIFFLFWSLLARSCKISSLMDCFLTRSFSANSSLWIQMKISNWNKSKGRRKTKSWKHFQSEFPVFFLHVSVVYSFHLYREYLPFNKSAKFCHFPVTKAQSVLVSQIGACRLMYGNSKSVLVWRHQKRNAMLRKEDQLENPTWGVRKRCTLRLEPHPLDLEPQATLISQAENEAGEVLLFWHPFFCFVHFWWDGRKIQRHWALQLLWCVSMWRLKHWG